MLLISSKENHHLNSLDNNQTTNTIPKNKDLLPQMQNMSRKRLSVRRQNELSTQDKDLPFLQFRATTYPDSFSTSHIEEDTASRCVEPCENDRGINDNRKSDGSMDSCSGSDLSSISHKISDGITESDKEIVQTSLREDLREFVIEESLTMASVNKLLRVLNPYHPELPLDSRTLLQTSKHISDIRDMDDGRYCHLGLKTGLTSILSKLCIKSEPLQLLFNIDGLPITKGGEKNFWPILCRVANVDCSVFPVGIYEGKTKPKCFNTFISEFVAELQEVVENGIEIDGQKYQTEIKGFIMDAPATASVMYVVPYNAYHGCRKCWATGMYEGKVVFPELRSDLRSNADFRNRNCPDHHTGLSELQKLDINMVEDFPLDPMHLLYLGVVKKIIGQWMDRKRGGSQKLTLNSIKILNERMINYTKFYPQEFQRKPRRIDHYKMWKATEFRDFLLYTGPVALKDILSASTYKHFMALSTAARILSSNDYLKYNKAASDLLYYVVRHFRTLYGISHMTYNVHGLLHLASDSAKFGPLDSFSAFKFESYLGKLKRKLRTAYLPLPQICNRISEMRSLLRNDKKKTQKEVEFSKPIQNTNKFAQATFNSYKINANKIGQNCVLMNTQNAVKVRCFIGEDKFLGEKVENVTEFHNKPRSLKELHNIFSATFSDNEQEFFTKNIIGKFVYLPFTNDTFYFVPLIHTTQ